MKRKEFLKKSALGAVAGVAGASTLMSSCKSDATEGSSAGINVNSNKKINWRMTTVWGKNFPVFGEGANLLAEWVDKMSGGRFKIKIFGAGELAPGLEAFGTTADGTTEMGAGASYYWAGKTPAAAFFAAVPFGMNAQQVTAWMFGGEQEGYKLWKEVYAKFGLVPFPAGNTGVQMGGWFNKEINSVNDLKGLKMRIPGLAGRALEKAGGAAINVAPGELYTNMERGVIDATEWVGPYHDYKLGLNKVAKYYYTPGWHEPGTQLEFFANKAEYDKLPAEFQEMLLTASMRVHAWTLAEFDARNGEFLKKIVDEGAQVREFPAPVLKALKTHTQEAIDELIGSDPVANKVYKSYNAFREKANEWSTITEQAFYDKIQKI